MPGYLIVLILIVIGFAINKAIDVYTNRLVSKLNAEGEIWMKKEMSEPFCKVVVTTKNSKVFETETYKPSCRVGKLLGLYLSTSTAFSKARRRVDDAMSDGWFLDKDTQIYIPMCEIESLQIVATND